MATMPMSVSYLNSALENDYTFSNFFFFANSSFSQVFGELLRLVLPVSADNNSVDA